MNTNCPGELSGNFGCFVMLMKIKPAVCMHSIGFRLPGLGSRERVLSPLHVETFQLVHQEQTH